MNKIIDQNGRLFGRISIVDVFVLLIVALLALAFTVKSHIYTPVQSEVSSTPVTYTLICRSLESHLAADICVGDALFDHDQETNGTIGTIVSVEILPSEVAVFLPDGTLTTAELGNRSDVYIEVEGSANITDGHYLFNNVYELGVNAYRNFYTRFTGFAANVSSIAPT